MLFAHVGLGLLGAFPLFGVYVGIMLPVLLTNVFRFDSLLLVSLGLLGPCSYSDVFALCPVVPPPVLRKNSPPQRGDSKFG